jgi:hypothetical protein
MSATPCNALASIATLLASIKTDERGMSPVEADLVDDLERFLLDFEHHEDEAGDGHRDYRYTRGPKKGRRMPGVTGVMKSNLGWSTQPLTRWSAREAATAAVGFMLDGAAPHDAAHRAKFAPFSQRDAAADVGKLAHAMIVAFLREVPHEEDPFLPSATTKAAGDCLRKFMAWWDPKVWEVLGTEIPLVDEDIGFGGTLDLVLRRRVDGAVIVSDLKTGKGIHDDTLVQLGGYCGLLLRHKPEWTPVGGGLVIHVPVEGDLRAAAVSPETLALGTQAFAALMILHNARKQLSLAKENL